MRRIGNCLALCLVGAHASFCQAAPPDAVFADGFEPRSYLTPLWLPDACDTPAIEATYEANTPAVFNTDFDMNCTGGIVPQSNGPAICVVRAKYVRIGGALSVAGLRALALVADTSLVVDGTLDASAHGEQSGPGGGARVSGGASTSANGGGGAGFATNGGAGGSPTAAGGGGLGGTAISPLDLPVFEGGPSAAPQSFQDPDGGGGGGGLLLIACRGAVTTTGTINVGGGGGEAAFDTLFGGGIALSKGGGGGGAGGYVVLQGLTLDIGGGLFANGGGGGGGNSTNDGAGTAGANGTTNTSAAPGGPGSGTGGKGGDGGAKSVPPTNGGLGQGAGGGGSVGVLQLCKPTGVTPVVQPSLVTSPDLAAPLDVPVNQ